MPARSVCLVTLSYPKLDADASAARYPSQTSTIPYHTIPQYLRKHPPRGTSETRLSLAALVWVRSGK